MNTKFDVGQRVTYPVVHTADGNITGIAVSKSGVTRYAIGPKWYTEDDLRASAGDKPDMGNPIMDFVIENKPEPVKLYGIKDNSGWVTKGKIYEFVYGNIRFDEFFGGKLEYESFEKFKEYNTGLSACLVPLVRRPAKVGDWVYVLDRGTSCYEEKQIYKVFDTGPDSCVWFAEDFDGNIRRGNYLVLDGYTGDPA